MDKIDYGPIGVEMEENLEGLRKLMPSENRLVFAKLLLRTVVTDGDLLEREVASVAYLSITNYFRSRFP